jgi:cytochrome c biogenesis factor
MMNEIGLWVAPLSFLPAICLLILSTANRYARIKTVIYEYTNKEEFCDAKYLKREFKRAKLMKNSLFCLYLAVAVIAFGTMLALITEKLGIRNFILNTDIFLAVTLILITAILMIYETSLSLKIMQNYLKTKIDL